MARQGLGRDDWLRVARTALLHGGPAAVRVERLAGELDITRGSFYWHFADRAELLDALLREWEDELRDALTALPSLQGDAAVRELTAFLAPRVAASERGDCPSDAAIFAWAASDEAVAARVNAAELHRVEFLKRLVGDDDVGEFLYLAYLGFVMRRRRSPSAAAYFPTLALLMERAAATLPASRAGESTLPRTTGVVG
jgi:AcrR family transcriptional regulator